MTTTPPWKQPDRDWIEFGFRRGFFETWKRWDSSDIRYAEELLTKDPSLRVPFVFLEDTTFEQEGCLRDLIQLLACHRQEFQGLNFSVCAYDEAAVAVQELCSALKTFGSGELKLLRLELRGLLSPKTTQCLRELVKLSEDLYLVFDPGQTDFSACLESLREGIWECSAGPARVTLANVNLCNDLARLQALMEDICINNSVWGLQLCPSQHERRMTEPMGFLRAMIRLLVQAPSRLELLEIKHFIKINSNDPFNDDIIRDFRHAMETNDTVKTFSTHGTCGFNSLWIHAVLPALQVNRTINTIDFSNYENRVIVDHLLSLGLSKSLRVVKCQTVLEGWNRFAKELAANTTMQRVVVLGNRFPFQRSHSLRKVGRYCSRNRWYQRALHLLEDDVTPQQMEKAVELLADAGKDEMGLLAVYTLLRALVQSNGLLPNSR